MDRFVELMNKNGAELSKTRIRFYEPTRRGVHATCNIKKDDIVMMIPLEGMMTELEALGTQIGE